MSAPIIRPLYLRVRRINPTITSHEAAYICRPYTHRDGSVERAEQVERSALSQAQDPHIRWGAPRK